MLSQQAAGVLHAPVGRRVQRGPAVPIPELRVVASLKEQPGGQEGLESRTKTEALHQGLPWAGCAVTHDSTELIPGRWRRASAWSPSPAQQAASRTCRRGSTLSTVTPGCGTDSPRAVERLRPQEGQPWGRTVLGTRRLRAGSQPKRYRPPGTPGSVWRRFWLSQLAGACQGCYQHPTVRGTAPQQRLISSKTPGAVRLRNPGLDDSEIISMSDHRIWAQARLEAQGKPAPRYQVVREEGGANARREDGERSCFARGLSKCAPS